ncbi:MAG TPA: FecR domain-containing protein [Methylotenera sp.]|nr:FecR domain-containing protein [Methylotenera sp.]HPN01415.1 FecR domain-containing protein [Methylotenera sp.]
MCNLFLVKVKLTSATRLLAWQALLVFGLLLFGNFSAEAAEVNEPDWAYSVKPNDTFYSIYRQFLSKQSDIAQLSTRNHHKLSKRLLPGQVLKIPVSMLKKIPVSAQVLVASGEVSTQLANQLDEQKLIKGQLLNQGDSIKTGKYSVAKLGFPDGSVIDIQQNSQLVIQSSYQHTGRLTYVILLKLVKGRTEIGANPSHLYGNSMQILTPSAIAAVRGTTFRVRADQELTMQETLAGRVGLTSLGKEVMLAQGYGSIAEKNKAPLPPIALPSTPNLSHLPTVIESEMAVNFQLKPQTDAVAWLVQLAKDVDFNDVVYEQTVQASTLNLGVLTEGSYYLRVRAQGREGLQGKDALHVFAIKRPILPVAEPQLKPILPSADAIIPLAPTHFEWSPLPSTQQYLLQVSRDIDFKDVVFEQLATHNQLSIKQSFGSGQYYWRVAAISNGKPQVFSEVRKFIR